MPEELGFTTEQGQRYMPTHWFGLYRILKRRDVGPDDVLVDFGSGMGLVVYQAAVRYPLKRVEGVELSPQLSRIASGNIDRNRHKFRCRDVRLITCNALDYRIPDDMTIAYMFNPFSGAVFADVLGHIMDSLAKNPRRLRLIYFNPVEEAMVLDAGLQMTRQLRGLRPGKTWARSNATRLYEIDTRVSQTVTQSYREGDGMAL